MKMLKRALALFLLLTAMSVACAKTPIPNYDVSAYCNSHPHSTDCFDDQNSGRAIVQAYWDKIGENERQECLHDVTDNSYDTLSVCVVQYAISQ